MLFNGLGNSDSIVNAVGFASKLNSMSLNEGNSIYNGIVFVWVDA